jgi:hypothetical protein
MVWKALLNRNLPLLVLCLDLAVPPLSLLVLVIVFLVLVSVVIVSLGAPRSILYLSTAAMFAVSAISLLVEFWSRYSTGAEVSDPSNPCF